ncbi:DUF3592 domain-containing protein [Streptomyces olivochromogenes]|uniref:DUF3592 domain-containing protein n=1 Tax=Streptomyces olivochromogenes TaxID=1963 RepID=UPI001F1C2DFE|nr:DUF3592 domain-containing protein [Streptomyces olivochromogenes]MCF3135765.1 DUF3592 domain-containing protein [Streptomyces olivochromogenes]
MEALFYVIPLIMIAGVSFAAVRIIGRSRQISRAWSHGLTAEARCLRSYTTTSGGGGDSSVSTTLHHVYEFTTREGRTVRFEESNGPGTVIEGDFVTVHYLPEQPERATAHPPARGKLAAGTGCMLVFFGVFISFCIVFMVMAHVMFAESDGLMP